MIRARLSNISVRNQDGFTLIELLVAMVTGIVVVGAAFAILEVSLRQQSITADKVAADQLGRTTMTKLLDELHSGCVGSGTAPIQAPSSTPESPLAASGSTNLWFISAYGSPSAAHAEIEKVYLHDINWTKTGTSNTGLELGTLNDYSFANSGGSAPEWVWPSLTVANATVTQLATNVVPGGSAKVPLFRFYGYESGKEELSSTALTTPLTTTTSEEAAKVVITFAQASSDADTRTGRTASMSSSVIFRLSPTSEESSTGVNTCI